MSKEPDYCPQCGGEIDVTTCQCGDAITEDRAHAENHLEVPMGCACHYEDHAAQAITLRIRWAAARKRILVLEAGAAFHNVTVRQRNSAVDEAERLTAERDRLAAEVADLRTALEVTTNSRDANRAEVDRLSSELDKRDGHIDYLSDDRDTKYASFRRLISQASAAIERMRPVVEAACDYVDRPRGSGALVQSVVVYRAALQAPVVGAHGANPVSLGDVWIGETRPQLPVPDEVHERGWQWRPVGDGAFAPPFGTIRVCTGCGCLVAGGPTRCGRCAKEVP